MTSAWVGVRHQLNQSGWCQAPTGRSGWCQAPMVRLVPGTIGYLRVAVQGRSPVGVVTEPEIVLPFAMPL